MSPAPSSGGLRRLVWLGLWLALLGLLAAWSIATLRVSGDLRLFMPAPQTPDQALLLHQLGEGPGNRLLLVALSGGEADALAERSRALRERLRDEAGFVWIANGEDGLDDVPEALQDYRYLLSPGPAEGSLGEAALRRALQERLQDLASPAAALVAPLLAKDPTLETLRVLQGWTPASEPARHDGVWVSADATQALLLVETRAPGFDPQGQQAALRALRGAHAAVLADEGTGPAQAAIEISGPGAFAERMAGQTSREASGLGALASAALLLLMTLAYRHLGLALLGALPLASGALAGVACTAALSGEVHGITLAFGFTLLGVAQDYPVHLFSHRHAGQAPHDAARAIWPTLATGAGTTSLAYLVFAFCGVEGLRQLAIFTASGLAVAALATRFGLPAVMAPARAEVGQGRALRTLQRQLLQRAWPRWPAWLLAGLCAVVLVASPAPWWEDDLATLTPVPPDLLQRDRALRAELGAPDVRWLIVLRGDSAEAVLQRSEALLPELDALARDGVLEGVDLAARYLPSATTQRARQAALPDAATLAASLGAALQGVPFRPDAFAPFLAAVERARALPPLSPDDLAGTPLRLRIDGLLQPDVAGQGVIGLATVRGLQRPEALARWAAIHPDVTLLDLKQLAQSLASAWRGRVLAALAVAAVLLAGGLVLVLRSARRAARVLWPVLLGTALVLALLHGLGIALTLFHVMALVLAAGLGVDYALFFERAGGDPAAQRRTLHGLLVCAASTLLVFALLGLSQIPVLRAIGVTVGLGVVVHIVLSLWLAGTPAREESHA